MRLSRLGLAVGAALALLLSVGSSAKALSLADAVAGGTLNSSDGSLVFSDFEVTITGDLSDDPANYELVPLESGFRLAGPIGVADGELGDLLLSFTVETTGSLVIDGASLFSNVRAFGEGSLASVAEDLGGIDLGVQDPLLVLATGGGGFVPGASVSFAPVSSISITKDVLVKSSQPGHIAAISLVDQTFSVIPEPATLALVGLGSVGLLLVGRRRHASS